MKLPVGSVTLLLLVALLVAYPVFLLSVMSFNESPFPGAGAFGFTAKNYADLAEPYLMRALVNTLLYTFPKTILVTGVATLISWLIVRTDMPMKRIILGMTLLPLPLPALMIVIGLAFSFSPRTGVYNVLLRTVLNAPDLTVFNGYSIIGLITYGVVVTLPLGMLILMNAFRSVNAEMGEASKIAGSGELHTLFKVTLPLVAPAILVFFLLSIISGLQSMTGALFLGIPGGIRVLSLEVFNLVATAPPRYGPAAALSVGMLMLTTGLLIGYTMATRMQQKYATVGGRGRTGGKPVALGRLRYVVAISLVATLSFIIVIPIGTVIIEPFRAASGPYTWADITQLTLANFLDVLGGTGLTAGGIGDAFQITIWVAAFGALLCAALAMFVSYLKFRTNARGRDITYTLAAYPLAVPAIVVSLTVLYATARTPFYGTAWAVALALIIHGLPYALAIGSSTMFQIKPELEESARTAGASWIRAFSTVMFPLLSGSYFAAVMYLMAQFVSTLEVVLLLRGPGVEFLSTQLYATWNIGSFKWSTAIAVLMLVLTALMWFAAKLIDLHVSRGARRATLPM